MKTYRYVREDVRIYPDILIPGEGSLVANPGDEREFEQPPDNAWVEVEPTSFTFTAPEAPVTPAFSVEE